MTRCGSCGLDRGDGAGLPCAECESGLNSEDLDGFDLPPSAPARPDPDWMQDPPFDGGPR